MWLNEEKVICKYKNNWKNFLNHELINTTIGIDQINIHT